jgi:hypothetical protein
MGLKMIKQKTKPGQESALVLGFRWIVLGEGGGYPRNWA